MQILTAKDDPSRQFGKLSSIGASSSGLPDARLSLAATSNWFVDYESSMTFDDDRSAEWYRRLGLIPSWGTLVPGAGVVVAGAVVNSYYWNYDETELDSRLSCGIRHANGACA